MLWAKRVKAQRAQAAVLNTLTKSKQFDKIKISKKSKDDKARAPVNWTTQCAMPQITNHTVINLVALPIIQCVNA